MPPERMWPERVHDVLDQVELILAHTSGVDWDRFATDMVLQGDVLYRLSIIGEAVANIPEPLKTRYPSIPWRDVRNMRNVITHVYFGVDLARVWDVIEQDLRPLASQLTGLLQHEGGDRG